MKMDIVTIVDLYSVAPSPEGHGFDRMGGGAVFAGLRRTKERNINGS